MRSRYNSLLWDNLTVGKLGVSPMEGGQRNIWWFETCFGRFLSRRGPIGPSQDPQWFQMDDLVFYEKSRYKILLWDDVTVGKLGVSPMEADKMNIGFFEACFGCFLAWRGPQPPYPMVPNRQLIVPWKFEIQNCTMGWFNYGKTGC